MAQGSRAPLVLQHSTWSHEGLQHPGLPTHGFSFYGPPLGVHWHPQTHSMSTHSCWQPHWQNLKGICAFPTRIQREGCLLFLQQLAGHQFNSDL